MGLIFSDSDIEEQREHNRSVTGLVCGAGLGVGLLLLFGYFGLKALGWV